MPTGALPQRASPESGFLLNIIMGVPAHSGQIDTFQEGFSVEARELGTCDGPSAFVPIQWMERSYPLYLRQRSENIADNSKSPRRVLIIRIEPGHDLSSSMREPFVYCMISALVRLAGPPS